MDVLPPKPPLSDLTPWSKDMPIAEAIEKATAQMAVAWGESMTNRNSDSKLPALPLFSSLDEDSFVKLADSLEPVLVKPGQKVINEGDLGMEMFIIAFGLMDIERLDNNDQTTLVKLATLGPGAFFGEMAIVSRTSRAASVTAKESALLLKADKPKLEQLALSSPQIADVLIAFCHARMLKNLIQISPVLNFVPVKSRADLIARFHTDYFSGGTQIIVEGDPPKGLFLIVSGQVSILKNIDNENSQVAVLSPGDLFGEISLILQKPSTATVTAAEDTAVLMLEVDDFKKVTDEFPELLKGVFDIAIEREKKNNSILAQKTVTGDGTIIL
jgi:CRP-like cAMP-binding protein